MEDLLTQTEAAVALGMRPREFHRLRMRGEGPTWVTVGCCGGLRYRFEDLDAWRLENYGLNAVPVPRDETVAAEPMTPMDRRVRRAASAAS